MQPSPICRQGYQERQIEIHGIPRAASNIWYLWTWPWAECKPIPQAQPDTRQKSEKAVEPYVECLLETVMISCATMLTESVSYKFPPGTSVQIP